MNKRALTHFGIGITLVLVGVWGARLWMFTHPHFTTVTVDMPDFTISIPSHWGTDKSDDPRLHSDRHLSIMTKPAPGEDAPEWTLFIDEESTASTVASIIGEARKDSTDASPVSDIELRDGLTAKTWVDWTPFTELAVQTRWYVFAAPNGRVYCAMHWLPPKFAARHRYENLFKEALRTFRFKER